MHYVTGHRITASTVAFGEDPAELVLNPKQPDEDLEPDTALAFALVSPDDPAVLYICRAAARIAEFGYDPSDPDVAARIIEVGRRDLKKATAEARRRLPGECMAAVGEFVYYMRIGDRVKIGWTTNLPARIAAINPEEVMATEPGGFQLEQHRHRQFAHLRTHGEWFVLNEQIRQHVNQLVAAAVEDQTNSAQEDFGRLISAQDAARLAGVSINTIYVWMHRRQLPMAQRAKGARPLFRVLDVAKAGNAAATRAARSNRAS